MPGMAFRAAANVVVGLRFNQAKKLLQAAERGDAKEVSEIISSNPQLAAFTGFSSSNSALHRAAENGHLAVCKAIVEPLKRKSSADESSSSSSTGSKSKGSGGGFGSFKKVVGGSFRAHHGGSSGKERDGGAGHDDDAASGASPAGSVVGSVSGDHPAQPNAGQVGAAALGIAPPPGTQASRWHRTLLHVLDQRTTTGMTPLLLACANGHANVAAYLLRQGSNALAYDWGHGRTALHHAALGGHADCVRLLVSPETRVCPAGGGEPCALRDALMGEGATSRNAVGVAYVDARALGRLTALHLAAVSGNLECVQALLGAGAATMPRTSGEAFLGDEPLSPGSTPLHVAVLVGSLPIAHAILQRHAQRMSEALRGDRPSRDARGRRPWEAHSRTDLRSVRNQQRRLPYHLARQRHRPDLQALVDPRIPMDSALDAARDGEQGIGPKRLSTMCAFAMQRALLSWLDECEQQQALEEREREVASRASAVGGGVLVEREGPAPGGPAGGRAARPAAPSPTSPASRVAAASASTDSAAGASPSSSAAPTSPASPAARAGAPPAAPAAAAGHASGAPIWQRLVAPARQASRSPGAAAAAAGSPATPPHPPAGVPGPAAAASTFPSPPAALPAVPADKPRHATTSAQPAEDRGQADEMLLITTADEAALRGMRVESWHETRPVRSEASYAALREYLSLLSNSRPASAAVLPGGDSGSSGVSAGAPASGGGPAAPGATPPRQPLAGWAEERTGAGPAGAAPGTPFAPFARVAAPASATPPLPPPTAVRAASRGSEGGARAPPARQVASTDAFPTARAHSVSALTPAVSPGSAAPGPSGASLAGLLGRSMDATPRAEGALAASPAALAGAGASPPALPPASPPLEDEALGREAALVPPLWSRADSLAPLSPSRQGWVSFSSPSFVNGFAGVTAAAPADDADLGLDLALDLAPRASFADPAPPGGLSPPAAATAPRVPLLPIPRSTSRGALSRAVGPLRGSLGSLGLGRASATQQAGAEATPAAGSPTAAGAARGFSTAQAGSPAGAPEAGGGPPALGRASAPSRQSSAAGRALMVVRTPTPTPSVLDVLSTLTTRSRSVVAGLVNGRQTGPDGGHDGDDDCASSESRGDSHEAGSAHDEECGVCLDHAVEVAFAGCEHKLCFSCARNLTRMTNAPPHCPFCRRMVVGFTRVSGNHRHVQAHARASVGPSALPRSSKLLGGLESAAAPPRAAAVVS